MQKKIILLLTSLLACGSIVSCANNKTEITNLTFGKLYDENAQIDDNFEVISINDLRSLIEKKNNFALIVYDKTSTCTCWYTFKDTIRRYMKVTNCLFYAVDSHELADSGESFGLKTSTGNETIAIFRDGVVKAQKNTSDSNDKFTSDLETFMGWMKSNAQTSDMLYITESQMEKLFKGNEGFTLGFLRKTCSDCAYLSDHVLKEYNSKERNTSYVLECDTVGIRLDEDKKVNQSAWNEFKAKMGLTEGANKDYGYGEGYVPTFVRYIPDGSEDYASCIYDAAVYMNDVVEKVGGEYLIKNSYYTEERIENLAYLDNVEDTVLVGKKYENDEVIETSDGIVVKTEASAKYHDPLFKTFLDFYIGM